MVNRREINGFNIVGSSNLDYEKNVIYLNFNNNQVAVLSCDEGINHAKIEILDRYEDKVIWSLSCQDFMTALNLAFEELKLNDH